MPRSENRSLADLPLDIIMEILFYLPFQDLESLSKTCKTLRVLSNESVTYHRSVNGKSTAAQWTKRLLFDFLHVINQKEHLLNLVATEKTSIVNAIRDLQARFELGTQVPLLGQSEHSQPQELTDVAIESESPTADISLQESGVQCSVTVRRNSALIDKDGLAYLKILQGFQRIATNSHKLSKEKSSHKSGSATASKSEDATDRPETPTKRANINVALTPFEFQTYPSNSKGFTEGVHCDDHSPDSSYHSRSTSSIFSEVPKLSDLAWSYSDELKNLDNGSTDSESEHSSDSSSSTKYLRELQRSTKVSDKKYLFERLNTRIQKINDPLNSKDGCEKKDLAPALRPASITTRSLSQGYLVEVERCNSHLPSGMPLEASKSSLGFLTRYEEHLANGMNLTSHETTRKRNKQRRQNQAPHRRTLIAKITDKNRISYEKC
ncbi:LANO_0E11342g1_1 [Lachancea nothofagi CBS 11611]|uniref:LANO_0E11342g1_1 n=1 Tax=Lachancea nothofagi CBS 11611 TaxID=1266666 RepID=A0A1G4JXF4_9SACH|nr:LANO_0E11342g1_1 [Lachancea nothofagi CBS 11611]